MALAADRPPAEVLELMFELWHDSNWLIKGVVVARSARRLACQGGRLLL